MKIKFLWIFVFIFTFSFFSLNADDVNEIEHYVIAEYQFLISGSSSENLIRKMVIPEAGDPIFPSLEALDKALAQKQRTLFNKRVFTSVEYSLEELYRKDNISYYLAIFEIDDAFTFLAIPYPKYDSNYGFRLGLKAWESNLFGTFSTVDLFGHITQINESWDNYVVGGEATLAKLPIGSSHLNLSGYFSGTLKNKEFDFSLYAGEFTWSDIPIGATSLSLSGAIDQDALPYGSLTWQGFKVGTSNIKLTSAITKQRVFSTTLNWDSIPVGTTRISIQPGLEVARQSDFSWLVSKIKLNTVFIPVPIFKHPFSLTNAFVYHLQSKKIDGAITLNMQETTIASHPIAPWFSYSTSYEIENNALYNTKYTLGVSTSFRLPHGFSYQPSLSTSILVNSKLESFMTPILTTSQTLSGSSINWYNNLRKGLGGKIHLTGEYLFLPSNIGFNIDAFTFTAEVNAVAFALIGKRLSFSTRLLGYYRSIPSNDTSGTTFTYFMPGNELSPADELRGILTKSFNTQATSVGQSKRKLGFIANVDATLLLIKIQRFGEAFVNVFFDFGLFTKSSATPENTIANDDLLIFKTVGLEGYGILDRFRSYPIRASIGFNLDHVIEYVNKQRTANNIEFEISIGMGLLY